MSGISRSNGEQERSGGHDLAKGRPSDLRAAARVEHPDRRHPGRTQRPSTNYSRSTRVDQLARNAPSALSGVYTAPRYSNTAREAAPERSYRAPLSREKPLRKKEAPSREYTASRKPNTARRAAAKRSHRAPVTEKTLSKEELSEIYTKDGIEGLAKRATGKSAAGTIENLAELFSTKDRDKLHNLYEMIVELILSSNGANSRRGCLLLKSLSRHLLMQNRNQDLIEMQEKISKLGYKPFNGVVLTNRHYLDFASYTLTAYCNLDQFSMAVKILHETLSDLKNTDLRIRATIGPLVSLFFAAKEESNTDLLISYIDALTKFKPSDNQMKEHLPGLPLADYIKYTYDIKNFVKTISGLLENVPVPTDLLILRVVLRLLSVKKEFSALIELYERFILSKAQPSEISLTEMSMFPWILDAYISENKVKEIIELNYTISRYPRLLESTGTRRSLMLLQKIYNKEEWDQETQSRIAYLKEKVTLGLKAEITNWMETADVSKKDARFSAFLRETLNLGELSEHTTISTATSQDPLLLSEGFDTAHDISSIPAISSVDVVVTQKNSPDFGLVDPKYLGLPRSSVPSVESHSDSLRALEEKKVITFKTLAAELQYGLDVSEHELSTLIGKGKYYSTESKLPEADQSSMLSFIRLGRGLNATVPTLDATPAGRVILIAHPKDLGDVDPKTLVGERRDVFLISSLNGYTDDQAGFAYPRRLAALSIAHKLGYADLMLLDDNVESFYVSTPLHPQNANWDDLYSLYRKAGQEAGVSIVSSKTIDTGWSGKQCFSDELEVEKNSLGAKVDWINLDGLDLSELLRLNPPRMSLWGENYWFTRCLAHLNKDKQTPVFASITRNSLVIKRAGKLLNTGKAAMTGNAPALAWFDSATAASSPSLQILIEEMRAHVKHSQSTYQSRNKATQSIEWIGAQQLSFKKSLQEDSHFLDKFDAAPNSSRSSTVSNSGGPREKVIATSLQAMPDPEISCVNSLLMGLLTILKPGACLPLLRRENLRPIQEKAIVECTRSLMAWTGMPKGPKPPIFNIQLATGAGKTRVFATLALAYQKAKASQKHVLIVCPSIDLTQQARQAFTDLGLSPYEEKKIIEVHSGSTGSLNAKNLSLEMLQKADDSCIIIACGASARAFTESPETRSQFGCVLFDEYHLMSDELIQRFNVNSSAGPVVIGFSATGDGKSCGDCILKYNLIQAHDDGLVSGWKIEQFTPAPEATSQVEHLYSHLSRISHPDGKKLNELQGMIVVSRIKEAQDLGLYLSKAGLKTVAINSENGPTVNGSSINLFKENKIQILVTVDMLQEGTNLPPLRWVLIARHINSTRLIQLLGRAIRLDHGKTTAYVGIMSKIDKSFDLPLEYPLPEGSSLTSRVSSPTPKPKRKRTREKAQKIAPTRKRRRETANDSSEEETLWVLKKKAKRK